MDTDVEMTSSLDMDPKVPLPDEKVIELRPEFATNSDMLDQYHCVICHRVLQNPMQSPMCGHRFCSSCVNKLFQDAGCKSGSGGVPCPAKGEFCDKIVPDDDTDLDHAIFVDYAAENDLQEEQVFCVFKCLGCTWQNRLKLLSEHVITCSHRPVSCPNCSDSVPKGQLDLHIKMSCSARFVSCKHCKANIRAADIPEHERNECPNFLIPCPHECGEPPMPQSKLDDHLKECKKVIGRCVFNDVGCEFVDSTVATKQKSGNVGQDLKKHQSPTENYDQHIEHMRLVMRNVRTLNLENATLRRQLSEAEQKNSTAQVQIDMLTRLINEFRNGLEDYKKDNEKRLEKYEREGGRPTVQNQEHFQNVQQMQIQLNELKDRMVSIEHAAAGTNLAAATVGRPGAQGDLQSQMRQLEERVQNAVDTSKQVQGLIKELRELSTSGILIWRLDNWGIKLSDAKTSRMPFYDSPDFYTSKYGYHLRARIYPNGDGAGRNNYISLFFLLLKGDYDELLPWPFKQKVTFMILDQETNSRHVCDTFRPDPNSASFKRPISDANPASGCPLFISHELFKTANKRYLNNDTLYVKVVVDTSDLYLP